MMLEFLNIALVYEVVKYTKITYFTNKNANIILCWYVVVYFEFFVLT